MIILGINSYHGDSSAAIIKDGKLIAAIEEERIRRIKHWAGFPTEAIKWCLSCAETDILNVDYIAISRNSRARFHKKLFNVMRMKKAFLKERLTHYKKFGGTKKKLAEFFSVKEKDIKAKIFNCEHHRAHLASSFLVSPFEEAALISIDSFGDSVSTMTGIGKGNKIKVLKLVDFPHSLGMFYSALTQFLGFWNYGDEYKVMGLSAMGKPVYLNEMRKIVQLTDDGLFKLDTSYFLHDSQGVEFTWENGVPGVGALFSDKLETILGQSRKKEEQIDQRIMDIAASIQEMYEEALFHMLQHLQKETGLSDVALAGGCIQNSLANGKICAKTPFKNIYIPPAAHDAGGAIGAVFYVHNQVLGNAREAVMTSPFLGPQFENSEIKKILEENGLSGAYEELTDDELFSRVAGNIADGKIVGWFQGRAEWGPRALGNRSILADPRRKEMKDILNSRIKRREWFRPFAPSILLEESGDWFEDNHSVPFMEKVFKIKEEKRPLIPTVCHVDGSGRLQTVDREISPKYYGLIEKFKDLTGVPILLNTSFNENEPIVNTPKDALDCFLRTKMDVLVMGNYYISR